MFPDHAAVIIPRLLKRLRDEDETVRSWSISALGDFAQAPTEVVPALIDLLEREGQTPRPSGADFKWICLRALSQFGPDAKAAVPVLKRLIFETDEIHVSINGSRETQVECLGKIDPDAAKAYR